MAPQAPVAPPSTSGSSALASYSTGQLEFPAALAEVDPNRCVQLITRLPGSRPRKGAALHNQDWRPSVKTDRPKHRRSIRLRIEKLVAPGDCSGERALRRGKLAHLVEWYEKEQWRQADSDEDYRERLSNNSKELDAEVLKVGKAPRVRKDAMPQLSVSFMVGKLKEFAVASTHKELDRIQNEFTIQASLPAPA